jgi:leucyl-tRNA synthetase
MAVPAHDTRDHQFAVTYGLEIRQVVEPKDGANIDVQVVGRLPTQSILNQS